MMRGVQYILKHFPPPLGRGGGISRRSLGGKNIKRGTAKEKGRKRIEMGETDVKKD